MTKAVLYRWRLKPGRDAEFREAWAEGTRRIHATCRSYGAALNQDEDGIYWSYALWPSEDARKACFKENDWFSQDCFVTMQDCIEERFEEIRLDVTNHELVSPPPAKTIPTLTTERLVLRPLELDDAEALLPALSDEANMRYWSSGPLESVEAVRDYLRWNVENGGSRSWAFARADTPQDALGWVVLIDRREGCAEIGYMSRPDAQGAGRVREAAQRVCTHAFEDLGLRRLYADTDPDNAGSIALLEALGFQLEGRLRGAWETHIGVRDSLIFGRLRHPPE